MASTLVSLEPWMWLVAGLLLVIGAWLSRSPRRVRLLPTWLCGLLVVAALVGMWFLLNYQFGGQFIGIG